MRFLAIDFETANPHRHSACAVGLVLVENAEIAERASYLIRPPTDWFSFTWLHGISWEDVKEEPTFRELWSHIEPLFRNVDFAVAHNAYFDRSVLKACCELAGLSAPPVEFKCTMQLARKLWKIYPTKLPDVCARFGIELRHHQALSDTVACAKIMIHALRHLESTGHTDSTLLRTKKGKEHHRFRKTGIMVEDYVSPYALPLSLKNGENVTIEDKESEWPGWVWCTGEAGQSMWTPARYLKRENSHGVMVREYAATELSAGEGEVLQLLMEESGWWWCENGEGKQGWVPGEKICRRR